MAGTELPVRDALCLPGILLTAAGALLVRHSVDVNAELRPILDAKAFDTLEDLDQALQNGLRLPATVAIRHAPAGTTDPVQPALSTGKAVLCLSTHLVETIDGSANAFNTRVRVRDSSALRKPSTWFVRGHGAALAVTPRVHTSLASPPWSSFQERRQAVADGNWQTLVSRRLLAVVLKQRLPSALITQERTLAVDSPVAVVGTLRHLLRKDSRFATPGSLRSLQGSLDGKMQRVVLDGVDGPPGSARRARLWPRCSVLVAQDYDDVRAYAAWSNTVQRLFGGAVMGVGVAITAAKAWHWFRRWQVLKRSKERERQELIQRAQRQADATAAGCGGEAAADATEDADNMDECMICTERKRNSAFPCGHVVACLPCALRCQRCPVCRRRGTAIELFRS